MEETPESHKACDPKKCWYRWEREPQDSREPVVPIYQKTGVDVKCEKCRSKGCSRECPHVDSTARMALADTHRWTFVKTHDVDGNVCRYYECDDY